MDFPLTENTYVIAWATDRQMTLVNMTEDTKRQVIRIIMDDPAKDLHSNPIRDLIVHAVSNRIPGFELWEVDSYLDETTIREEFDTSPDTIKSEIREHGTLLYAS